MEEDRYSGTCFASAPRATVEEVRRQASQLRKIPLFAEIMDAVPTITLVLNKERQIVFGNRPMLDLLSIADPQTFYGKRPGEVLNCIHADETLNGCGTTEYCSTCGAVLAVLAAQRSGERVVRECRITCKRNGDLDALDLRVWADRIVIEGAVYTVVSLLDVSNEKRREVLERTFLHDLRNTACALLGCSELLRFKRATTNLDNLIDTAWHLSDRLAAEIESQQLLLAAENNELQTTSVAMSTTELLSRLKTEYETQMVARQKTIILSDESADVTFTSDKTLVERVLGNMLKNALEATLAGGTVTLGATRTEDRVRLWVHNDGCMPRSAQLQIFQRSFSTKGAGRGIGTYSMKLLSERYLGGTVAFTSTPADGTTFYAEYPLTRS